MQPYLKILSLQWRIFLTNFSKKTFSFSLLIIPSNYTFTPLAHLSGCSFDISWRLHVILLTAKLKHMSAIKAKELQSWPYEKISGCSCNCWRVVTAAKVRLVWKLEIGSKFCTFVQNFDAYAGQTGDISLSATHKLSLKENCLKMVQKFTMDNLPAVMGYCIERTFPCHSWYW